ncbi:hypothetical protein [Azospirillum palustre]
MDGCCFGCAPYHGICSRGIGGFAETGTMGRAQTTRVHAPVAVDGRAPPVATIGKAEK